MNMRSVVAALCVLHASAALRRFDELDSSSGSSSSSGALGSSSTTSGDFTSCTVGGTVGDCTDASDCVNNGGTATPGYCPGPSNIQCCTNSNWGSCSSGGQSGYCTGRDACIASGNMAVAGLCPGPVDIECCVASSGPTNGSVAAMMNFAYATWDCDGSSPPCLDCATVAAGSAQTPYGCAPWVAQVLAAGGFLPGLSSCSDESNFYNVGGYNLNWVGGGGTGPGLIDYLQAVGWQQTSNPGAGSVCAAQDWGHAVLGIGSGLCAAHNFARWGVPCATWYSLDLCLSPP